MWRELVGAVLGLLASLLITLVISRTAEPEPTKSFLEFTSLFAFGYLGLVVGSSQEKRVAAHSFTARRGSSGSRIRQR